MVFGFAVLVTAGLFISNVEREPSQPTAAMKADVRRLVAKAEQLDRLWPWRSAIPEVARVVRHGRPVAPLLVSYLADDPDDPAPEAPGLTVQQQAAIALCRIFSESEECGRIYCNRAPAEVNKGVKKFWLSKISGASGHVNGRVDR